MRKIFKFKELIEVINENRNSIKDEINSHRINTVEIHLDDKSRLIQEIKLDFPN